MIKSLRVGRRRGRERRWSESHTWYKLTTFITCFVQWKVTIVMHRNSSLSLLASYWPLWEVRSNDVTTKAAYNVVKHHFVDQKDSIQKACKRLRGWLSFSLKSLEMKGTRCEWMCICWGEEYGTSTTITAIEGRDACFAWWFTVTLNTCLLSVIACVLLCFLFCIRATKKKSSDFEWNWHFHTAEPTIYFQSSCRCRKNHLNKVNDDGLHRELINLHDYYSLSLLLLLFCKRNLPAMDSFSLSPIESSSPCW